MKVTFEIDGLKPKRLELQKDEQEAAKYIKARVVVDDDDTGRGGELMRLIKSSSMWLALWDFENYLRYKYKHQCPEDRPEHTAEKEFEETREKFFEILQENGVNLEELSSG